MAKNVAVKERVDSVRGALEKMKSQMAMALPRHITPDRLLRVTMTAVQNTPKLLDCDRTSLFAAVMTCAQLGLEPDGVLGQAYLVPFKGKVQFIPGYKGYLTLARNSGEITSIQAHEVCQNDKFSYAYGLDEHLHHVPAEGERGEITHFYAYAKFKDGGHVFEVMTRADVEKIRDGSEGYKAFKAGAIKSTPWDSHYVQMGRKTAIRRLANYLPLSVQRAAALDAAYDAGKHGAIDDYGDVTIEGESQVIDDGEGEGETNPCAATAKLDALANGQAETKAKPKAAAKKAEPAKEPEPEPKKVERFRMAPDSGDIYDSETGEVVSEEHVKRFEGGGFSVLPGYYKRDEAPAHAVANGAAPASVGDELFGAEG